MYQFKLKCYKDSPPGNLEVFKHFDCLPSFGERIFDLQLICRCFAALGFANAVSRVQEAFPLISDRKVLFEFAMGLRLDINFLKTDACTP